jgi:hypothetical protein
MSGQLCIPSWYLSILSYEVENIDKQGKRQRKNREASLESGFLPIRLALRAGLAQE